MSVVRNFGPSLQFPSSFFLGVELLGFAWRGNSKTDIPVDFLSGSLTAFHAAARSGVPASQPSHTINLLDLRELCLVRAMPERPRSLNASVGLPASQSDEVDNLLCAIRRLEIFGRRKKN